MTTPSPLTTMTDSASGFPEVEFGRSGDGYLVARVGDTAFAMLPGRDASHYLATGWRISRPITEWRRSDFYGHSGGLADEAAFRARVAENAEHHREKRALGRRQIRSTAHTPWGPSQGAILYAEGVVCHSTAGHGGFHLLAERNRKVRTMLRSRGGWYEEDEAWAIVALTFPHLFTSFERRCAERTIRDRWPDLWEAIFGTLLQPGESPGKGLACFREAARRRLDRCVGDHLGPAARLSRMEEARRQTQHQLDMIDRQIIRRMTVLIPHLGRKRSGYRRGKPPDPSAFLERYRSNLAAITAERQPEIEALSRKLARQDAAIEAMRGRCAPACQAARDDSGARGSH